MDLRDRMEVWTAGCCEHGDELLRSIKCWKFLEQMRNCRLLKKDSAPWSYLGVITAQMFFECRDKTGKVTVFPSFPP
jgi:hypothetical protein